MSDMNSLNLKFKKIVTTLKIYNAWFLPDVLLERLPVKLLSSITPQLLADRIVEFYLRVFSSFCFIFLSPDFHEF